MRLWNNSQRSDVIARVQQAIQAEQEMDEEEEEKKAAPRGDKAKRSKEKELETGLRHMQSQEKAKKKLLERVLPLIGEE